MNIVIGAQKECPAYEEFPWPGLDSYFWHAMSKCSRHSKINSRSNQDQFRFLFKWWNQWKASSPSRTYVLNVPNHVHMVDYILSVVSQHLFVNLEVVCLLYMVHIKSELEWHLVLEISSKLLMFNSWRAMLWSYKESAFRALSAHYYQHSSTFESHITFTWPWTMHTHHDRYLAHLAALYIPGIVALAVIPAHDVQRTGCHQSRESCHFTTAPFSTLENVVLG